MPILDSALSRVKEATCLSLTPVWLRGNAPSYDLAGDPLYDPGQGTASV